MPFVQYLSFAPSAWTLSLAYAGGGMNSLGGIAIDSEGNMWLDNNFMGGAQSTIWGPFGGGISKIAPNGKPRMATSGRSIMKRARSFICPKVTPRRGRILGRTVDDKPVDGTLQVKGPFHLAVDQQDRIWVTNRSDTVTRFPANDPGKAEQITVGFVPRGVAIDSLGNAWVANCLGHPGTKEKLALVKNVLKSKLESLAGSASKADDEAQMWVELFERCGGWIRGVVPGCATARLRGGSGPKRVAGPWPVRSKTASDATSIVTGDFAINSLEMGRIGVPTRGVAVAAYLR